MGSSSHILKHSHSICSSIVVHWFTLYPNHTIEWQCGVLFPRHTTLGILNITRSIGLFCSLFDFYNVLCSSTTSDFAADAPGMDPALRLVVSYMMYPALLVVSSYSPGAWSTSIRVMARIPHCISRDISSTEISSFTKIWSPLLCHGPRKAEFHTIHNYDITISLDKHVTLGRSRLALSLPFLFRHMSKCCSYRKSDIIFPALLMIFLRGFRPSSIITFHSIFKRSLLSFLLGC